MARRGPGFGYGAQSPPVQDPRNPFSPQAYPQGYHQPGREYGDADSDIGDPYSSTARLAGNNGLYDSEYRYRYFQLAMGSTCVPTTFATSYLSILKTFGIRPRH